MKRTLLTLIFIGMVSVGMAQNKTTNMPDCGNFLSTVGSPCKTPVILNGKIVAYTVRKPEMPIATALLTSSRVFQTLPQSFHWFIFGLKMDMLTDDKPVGSLSDNVDSIRLHINKSQLHWLNDSTAIITKPKAK